jgi:hypothetical protein
MGAQLEGRTLILRSMEHGSHDEAFVAALRGWMWWLCRRTNIALQPCEASSQVVD